MQQPQQQAQPDDLEIFNTVKVNQRRSQAFLTVDHSPDKDIDNDFGNQSPPPNRPDSLGPQPCSRITNSVSNRGSLQLAKRKGSASSSSFKIRKRRIKKYNVVEPNIDEQLKDDMERAMRLIVYKYTRGQEELEAGKDDPIDYSGTGFLKKDYCAGHFAERDRQDSWRKNQKREGQEDFFERGIYNAKYAQEQKAVHMRRKLNQSVDMAEFKKRAEERQKRQYVDTQLYKDVSNMMTFDEGTFQKNVDSGLDNYMKNKGKKHKQSNELTTSKESEYDTSLPSVEQFVKTAKKKSDYRRGAYSTIQGAGSEGMYKEKSEKLDSYSSDFSEEIDRLNDADIAESPRSASKQTIEAGWETTGKDRKNKKKVKIVDSSQSTKADDKAAPPYNIRKNPQRRSASYKEIEKLVQEEKPNVDNQEEIRQIEKVFKMLHDYCSENLTIGYNQLDKHVEELLDSKVTVSPLLKYYNHLAKHCNFRLPCQSLLRFDQKYFRAFVKRLRDAQKVEIHEVRNQIVTEARRTLLKSFAQAKELLQNEVKTILCNYDKLVKELEKQKEQNRKLLSATAQQEEVIKEQRTYLVNLCDKNVRYDDELFFENGGGGPRSKRLQYGPVLKNIEEYHIQLGNTCQMAAEEFTQEIEKHYKAVQMKEKLKEGLLLKITPSRD